MFTESILCVLIIQLFAAQHSPPFDCFPESNASESLCIKRGCLWSDTIPHCYYPDDYGYVLDGDIETTPNGYTALITQRYPSYYDTPSIPKVRVHIYEETNHRLRIKFTDEQNQNARYQVPIDLPPIPSNRASNPLYAINFNQDISDIFGFNIYRKTNSKSLINTIMPGFIYSDQYISISMLIGSYTKIYGFGERFSDLLIPLNGTIISLFARDIWNEYPSYNGAYGVHPFGLFSNPSNGDSFGLLFVNSNAMDIAFTQHPSLQYRTIGGILDFYIFLGPKPLDVLQQYHELIGFTFFPPFWSFGFHLCRWGYLSLNNTKQIVLNMRNAMIPYDVQWLDIDYMDNYKVFTFDNDTFKDLPQFIEDTLHKEYNMKFIQIIDPGISAVSYKTYNNGINNDVFIKYNNNSLFKGKVWPGGTVFPDYFHENTVDWWINETKEWYNKIKFDGFWIDCNEPSNFGGDRCSNNTFDEPPYFPQQLMSLAIDDPFHSDPFGNGQDTVCMNTIQRYKNGITQHYNVHSLYGYSMTKATYDALSPIHERPFIISRSTFVSSGKYAGHWHGDNHAQFDHLKQSISGMIMFSMFGIPMNGADVCGFLGNTTIELCSRWIQIGAFYPFSRNHNALTSVFNTTAQDPPSLGTQVVKIHRKYLRMRYSLLPFLYTLFYKAHMYGYNVINALFMIWFDDIYTYDIDTQYLWGNTLLFAPAINEGQRSVHAYFPQTKPHHKGIKERWFNLENGEELIKNAWNDIDTPLNTSNIYIRGGNIIVQQHKMDDILTTVDSSKKPYKLVIAVDSHYNAMGDIFIDDGISNDYKHKRMFDFIEFNFMDNQWLNNTIKNNLFDNYLNHGRLDEIVIFGMNMDPYSDLAIHINGEHHPHFEYNSKLNVLTIIRLKLTIDKEFNFEFVQQKKKSEL